IPIFFFQAEDGIRDRNVTGVQTCALPICWRGAPAIDVAAGVVEQLSALEVPLEWVAGCAREDEALYSHRRDGTTGRFAGIVGRRTEERRVGGERGSGWEKEGKKANKCAGR